MKLKFLFTSFLIALLASNLLLAQQKPQFANYHFSNGSALTHQPLSGSTYSGFQGILVKGNNFTNAQQSMYVSPAIVGSVVITRIYLQSTQPISNTTYTDLTIKLGTLIPHTNTYAIGTSNLFATVTTVLDEASYMIPNTPANSWVSFDLTTPFTYNGNGSLIFEITHDGFTGSGIVLAGGGTNDADGILNYTTSPFVDGDVFNIGGMVRFGFDVLPSWDAGIDHFVSPSNTMCPGSRTIDVAIHNEGNNSFDSVLIHWTINGITQPSYNYNGYLPSQGKDTVSLGYHNFQWGQHDTIRVWTSMPGGNADVFNTNDTLLKIFTPTYYFQATLPNDTVACLGKSIELSAQLSGIASSYVWDDNSVFPQRTVESSGSYYVTVYDTIGCIARDTINVIFEPITIQGLGNDTTICAGDLITLPNPYTQAVSYLWNDNSTQATRNVSTSGVYYVTVTDSLGCMGSDTMNVYTIALPSINLGNNIEMCPGDTIILDAGYSAERSFLWDNNSTEPIRTVFLPGKYSVVVTDTNLCSNSDEIIITYKPTPQAKIDATYQINASYLFKLKKEQHVTKVVWDFGDGSPLEEGWDVTHTYKYNNTYSVTAHLNSVCSAINNDVSITIEVFDGSTSVKETAISDKNIYVYPNPFTQNFTLTATQDENEIYQVQIKDILGRSVFQIQDRVSVINEKLINSAAKWAKGQYILQIQNIKNRQREVLKINKL